MNEQPRANPARTGRVFMLSWEFELSGEDDRLISRGVTPINCLLQLSQQLGLQVNQLADRVCAGLIQRLTRSASRARRTPPAAARAGTDGARSTWRSLRDRYRR